VTVTLSGELTTLTVGGTATFEDLVVFGPSGAEFYIVFTAYPPLLPTSTPFPVILGTGGKSRAK
jgi:hypothetical protein